MKVPSRGRCKVEWELGMSKAQPGHRREDPLQYRRQAECRPVVDHRKEGLSHGRELVVVGSSEEGRLEGVDIKWRRS